MSMSVQSSQSTSTPTVTETPENAILDQLSGVAQGLAGQMLNWAQGVFAQTSQITNQAIGNFFNVSQQMMGLSNGLTSQYNNLFAPENAQLVADANSYASPARMAADMGMAGATQAQAGKAALANSEEDLRSFGIDPSSGRYAALDKAANVQNAANVAGAENQQRVSDIQTGQNLRQSAVQVGAQLPAAIANVNNTALQANTGAVNATLSNANTGKNLMDLPNSFLQTAAGAVKLPLQGQTSQSSSQGNSSSPQQPKNSPSGGGGGGAPGGGGGGNGASQGFNPTHGGGGGSLQSSPFIGGGSQDFGFNNGFGDTSANDFTGGEGSMGIGQEGTNDNIFNNDQGTGVGDPNPFSDSGFGQTLPTDNAFGGADNNFGGLDNLGDFGSSFDAGSNQAQLPSDWNDPAPSDPGTDWGSGADAFAGSGDSGGDFARGGAIGAGPVPRSMSPSGGQRVDDVPGQTPNGQRLNLNTDEFVIPRDVALWKGQEFFQNLIAQSRKKRVTAPAQPSAGPPQPQMQR